MIAFLLAPFAAKAVEKIAYGVTSLVVAVLLFGAPLLGFMTQPWWPWWMSGHATIGMNGQPVAVFDPATVGAVPIDVGGPVNGPEPAVSDVRRYLLAIGAGFTASEAITATAISIAENGGGSPTALSAANFDGSRDLGLWQINSGWWAQFGGQAALTNPVTNAVAANYIYHRQGWCAWSTYESSCGPGHNSAYAAYMGRARAAAAGTN